jgi:hypothetical protein
MLSVVRPHGERAIIAPLGSLAKQRSYGLLGSQVSPRNRRTPDLRGVPGQEAESAPPRLTRRHIFGLSLSAERPLFTQARRIQMLHSVS